MFTSGTFSAVALFNSLDKIIPKREAAMAKNKTVQSDIEYFKKNIQKINNVDDLFKDYRLLRISLEAYGLETEITKAGLIKGVLKSDPKNINSLVNRMNDPRFKEMANDFKLNNGTTFVKLQTFAIDIGKKLISVAVEKQLDQQAPGIRKAIHFQKVSSQGSITTPFTVLSDPNLRDVLLKARDIPLSIVIQPVGTQGRVLEKNFDFKKFNNKNYVDRIIQQYLAKTDIANFNALSTASLASTILSGSAGNNGGISLIV